MLCKQNYSSNTTPSNKIIKSSFLLKPRNNDPQSLPKIVAKWSLYEEIWYTRPLPLYQCCVGQVPSQEISKNQHWVKEEGDLIICGFFTVLLFFYCLTFTARIADKMSVCKENLRKLFGKIIEMTYFWFISIYNYFFWKRTAPTTRLR